MQESINIQVDGILADYGQVLLTMEKLKVEDNLVKMKPLLDFVLEERKKKENFIVAVAAICDYVVFYEEVANTGCCMYFMPYYTPTEIKTQILQDKQLIGYFDQLALSIRTQTTWPVELEFYSTTGVVARLYRNQLN